jgi:hypothetical protein
MWIDTANRQEERRLFGSSAYIERTRAAQSADSQITRRVTLRKIEEIIP